jgi:hypothetical protein
MNVFADAGSLAERRPVVEQDPHGLSVRDAITQLYGPRERRNSLSVN